ncbi:MAG: MOSC domain-containing protein [Luteitalea sp.]|nr:MOSC domain-containing protein [Luteitalea sp.]
MPSLEHIWIKRVRLGPMDSATSCRLIAGRGIVGNANQGGKRQVTILSQAAWETVVEQLGHAVGPAMRRANLFVSGVDLESSRGRILRVGSCRLLVHGETRPCERMEQAHPGLRAALQPSWRGGVFAEVLDDGKISVGDSVEWDQG